MVTGDRWQVCRSNRCGAGEGLAHKGETEQSLCWVRPRPKQLAVQTTTCTLVSQDCNISKFMRNNSDSTLAAGAELIKVTAKTMDQRLCCAVSTRKVKMGQLTGKMRDESVNG